MLKVHIEDQDVLVLKKKVCRTSNRNLHTYRIHECKQQPGKMKGKPRRDKLGNKETREAHRHQGKESQKKEVRETKEDQKREEDVPCHHDKKSLQSENF